MAFTVRLTADDGQVFDRAAFQARVGTQTIIQFGERRWERTILDTDVSDDGMSAEVTIDGDPDEFLPIPVGEPFSFTAGPGPWQP